MKTSFKVAKFIFVILVLVFIVCPLYIIMKKVEVDDQLPYCISIFVGTIVLSPFGCVLYAISRVRR